MFNFNRNVYQSLTMITQFGINMLVPVLLCSFLGIFLDKKLGTSYLIVILFFVGAIAGGYNCFRFARSIFSKEADDEAYVHRGRKKHKKSSMKDENYEKDSIGDK